MPIGACPDMRVCRVGFALTLKQYFCCYRAATGIDSSRFSQFESEFEKPINTVVDGFFRLEQVQSV
jgi:hypothetical protein